MQFLLHSDVNRFHVLTGLVIHLSLALGRPLYSMRDNDSHNGASVRTCIDPHSVELVGSCFVELHVHCCSEVS